MLTGVTPEVKKRLVHMYVNENKPGSEIARLLKVHPSTVYKYLGEAGVKFHSEQRRRMNGKANSATPLLRCPECKATKTRKGILFNDKSLQRHMKMLHTEAGSRSKANTRGVSGAQHGSHVAREHRSAVAAMHEPTPVKNAKAEAIDLQVGYLFALWLTQTAESLRTTRELVAERVAALLR
jgi:hypothetical protein